MGNRWCLQQVRPGALPLVIRLGSPGPRGLELTGSTGQRHCGRKKVFTIFSIANYLYRTWEKLQIILKLILRAAGALLDAPLNHKLLNLDTPIGFKAGDQGGELLVRALNNGITLPFAAVCQATRDKRSPFVNSSRAMLCS
jgi:hypothetical protein